MFTINLQGSLAGVIRELKAQKAVGDKADQQQIEVAKAAIEAEIEALGSEFNGVHVDASGDAGPAARAFQIRVVGNKLSL